MRFSVNLVSKWSCHPKFHQCEENLIGQTLQSHIHRCSKAIYSAHHPMHFCSACLCRPWWEFIDPSLEGRGHLVNHHIVNWKCSSFEKSFRHRVLIFVFIYLTQFSSVQSLSRVQLFVTPWTEAHQASLSITNSRSLPKPMSVESVMPSNHLILFHPLLLLPSIFLSIMVFSNKLTLCIRWPKYWSFSFNISPSNEHPGLISFRMDWLDLLAVQGTLNSLLQHHSSKASILWSSAFFTVQFSHPYMTIGKTIALTRRTFVDKVMSLLLNMLSRLVITFLPRRVF